MAAGRVGGAKGCNVGGGGGGGGQRGFPSHLPALSPFFASDV